MSSSFPPRTDGDARVESVRVAGDRRLAYAEYGDPDGAPLLFLHGTPGSRRLGRLLDGAAREHGVRVLAPDRPGYGRSDPWPDRTVAETADALPAVLDGAGVSAASLVAFSGGAPYALSAAARHPERVTRLEVVSGAVPPAISERTPRIQRLLRRLARSVPTLLGGLLRGQAWIAARADPDVVVSQYTTDGADEVPEDVAAVIRADFLEAIDGDASGAAVELRHAAEWGLPTSEFAMDVRFRHGTADTNVPIEDARRLARQIPAAEFDGRDGDDHLGALLKAVPDVVAAERETPDGVGVRSRR
ncbi:MAG: alpha/beta fold hydrolase [Halobellus sp.]